VIRDAPFGIELVQHDFYAVDLAVIEILVSTEKVLFAFFLFLMLF
jgi:hypothetical protein